MTTNHYFTATLVFFTVCLIIMMLLMLLQGGDSQSIRQARLRLKNSDNHERPINSRWSWFAELFSRWATTSDIVEPSNTPTDDTRTRLLRAGYFNREAIYYFTGINAITLILGLSIGMGIGYYLKKPQSIMLSGAIGTCLGLLIPRLLLSYQVRMRQEKIMLALPDAIDMIVLCLDGGTSFQAALQRVCDDLAHVHDTLALELKIVLREMQLGLSAGDSLMKLAKRCAISDVRELGLIVVQSEKYGASLSKTLRNYAETFRLQRQQRNEEQAQKTALKVLFPTMLCIFPAIFVIVLGPAAYQTATMFAK